MLPFIVFRRGKTVLNSLLNGKSLQLNPNLRSNITCRQFHFVKAIGTPLLSAQKSVRKLSPLYKCLVRRSATGTDALPKKIVGYWLLGCSGMVVIAVALGGTTRLTESGLSMVTWRLLGEKMPQTQNEWLLEFKRYQEYPEYKLLKRDITINEFKWIWYMEFAHRTWGRLIGAAFYIPAAFFWIRGYLTQGYKRKVIDFGLLLAMQGLLGWHMVRSGLEDRFHDESDIPRVSQYRLAAHLGLALLLFTATLHSALDILRPLPNIPVPRDMHGLKRMVHFCRGLIFLTALSGALVAGLDAGLLYNSFPKMGDKWIPEDILSLSPVIRNVTENPVTVQFDHRLLGTTTLFVITILQFMSQKFVLPKRTQTAFKALLYVGIAQVCLGVVTLINYVPTPVAVSHQSGSLALLSCAIWLIHELKFFKYMPK